MHWHMEALTGHPKEISSIQVKRALFWQDVQRCGETASELQCGLVLGTLTMCSMIFRVEPNLGLCTGINLHL
jgi:hypothetical protein